MTSSLQASSRQPSRPPVGAFRRSRALVNWGLVLSVAIIIGMSGGAVVGASNSARAATLEAAPDEWDKLQACERRVCKMILDKKAVEDVDCKVTKTWEKKTIKDSEVKDGVPTDKALKGDEAKPATWGFGNAQCKAHLTLPRSDIQAALTQPKHTINVPSQTVKCLVDRYGELKPVTATLAPRIDFKDGKAHKVWINLTEMDGPSDVKGTIQTAAKLEDTLGIFHGAMIRSINKWMYVKCDEKYGPAAEAKAQQKLEAETRRAEAKKRREANKAKREARAKARAAMAVGRSTGGATPAPAVKASETAVPPVPPAAAAEPSPSKPAPAP